MTQDEGADVQNRRLITTRHSNEKYSPAKIIEALRATRGMITTAARLLGCSRQTIYEAIARHPEINDVVSGERELMLDTAEKKLQEAVENGDSWAIRFYLATQGQNRGYIERQRGDEGTTYEIIIEEQRRPTRNQISQAPALPGSEDEVRR